MAKFRYQVATGQNQELAGVIAAPSIDVARLNLQKLGYRIEHIYPLLEVPESLRDKKVFAFEATNAEGKKITGSITTQSEEAAREKLEKGHHLIVKSLRDITENKPAQVEENSQVVQEAKEVLQKAEDYLQQLSPYDPDFNPIFDAKEDMRQMIRENKTEALGEKVIELLELIQFKEKKVAVEHVTEQKENVIHGTEDLLNSVHSETAEIEKSPQNFYFNTVLSELQVLSSWLLLFYAVCFVVAEILVSKNIPLFGNDFLNTSILSLLFFKIAFAVLVLHLYCRMKLAFFEKNTGTGILLGVLSAFIIIWTFLL